MWFDHNGSDFRFFFACYRHRLKHPSSRLISHIIASAPSEILAGILGSRHTPTLQTLMRPVKGSE
jgi:hypothetical protein